MGLKNELKRDEGQDFRKCNGIVMRCITTMFHRGWFKAKELMQSLDAYNLNCDNVTDAILYFADRDYIETRDSFSHESLRVCDCEDITELEIRLKADGVLVGKSLLEDVGIDL